MNIITKYHKNIFLIKIISSFIILKKLNKNLYYNFDFKVRQNLLEDKFIYFIFYNCFFIYLPIVVEN